MDLEKNVFVFYVIDVYTFSGLVTYLFFQIAVFFFYYPFHSFTLSLSSFTLKQKLHLGRDFKIHLYAWPCLLD